MSITVTREDDRWIARMNPFTYAEKDVIKAAGFRFDGQRKVWWTSDPAIAAKLGTPEQIAAINAEREQALTKAEASIVASRADKASAGFVVPLSAAAKAKGFDFFDYQKAAIEYALDHKDFLDADEMGLGKTPTAVGVMNADPNINNVLVICPASLKLNWRREVTLWLSRPLAIQAHGKDFSNGSFPTGGVVIVNYEMIGKYRQQIDAIAWDLLVVDEAHYLKNADAQRTANILGKWNKDPSKIIRPIEAKRRIFLTGTPILNRPKELWTLVHSLDPRGLGRNWKAFHVRYCAGRQESIGRGRYAWNVDGSSNEAELQAKLRATFMVRRKKADVLKELPPMRHQVLPFEATTEQQRAALSAERAYAAVEQQVNVLRQQVEKLSVDEASDAYKSAVAQLRKAQAVAFEQTSEVRHEMGLAKLPTVIEHVKESLEAEDKIIVMAHHRDVAAALAEAFAEFGCVKATGDDSTKVRDARVEQFQTDPSIRVFVATISAMGVGHTLHAASHVVFAELDWTPGKMEQAAARAHRIGQQDSVLVQHLVLDGSMDARIADMLVNKASVIEKAMDIGERLPETEAKRRDAERAERNAPKPDDLPPEQVEAIHTALKMIAGMCDGARQLDGCGFNKLDTDWGHMLAGLPTLSQGRAKAGKKLAIKYGRQIPADLLAIVKGEKD